MKTSDRLFAQNWIEQYRDNMANVRHTDTAQYRGFETASDVCAYFGDNWDDVVRYSFIWARSPQTDGLWPDRCHCEDYEALIC